MLTRLSFVKVVLIFNIVFISATCIGPLGMESGMIGDNQIQASSSFEHASVGPHNARFDHNYFYIS